MQPDIAAAWPSPQALLSPGHAADRLRLSLQAGPVCLMPRAVPDDVALALDSMAPDRLPQCDVSGAADRVRHAVIAATTCVDEPGAPAISWLQEDVLALMDLYRQATAANAIRVRLQVVHDDMCRRFHIDEVSFRLVTSYRGPGTEWIPPRLLSAATLNQPLDASAVRRLDRGTVAILRGARAATPDRPGVLHRSPPIEGSGQVRLFLAINEAGV